MKRNYYYHFNICILLTTSFLFYINYSYNEKLSDTIKKIPEVLGLVLSVYYLFLAFISIFKFSFLDKYFISKKDAKIMLREKIKNNDEDCSICFKEINEIKCSLIKFNCDCKYVYCKNCIEEWFSNGKPLECIICKKKISDEFTVYHSILKLLKSNEIIP